MAILLNNAPNNITEYPHSLKRQGAFPLEYYSVFQTLAAAQEYAQNNLVAYVGQPIAVTEETTSYYVIANTRGDLIKLGDGNLDINEVDRRLKEIEEFFVLEEGESLKDTLDELIELQKWIEEHLGDFDEFKEDVRKNLETEIRERTLEDKKLSEAIGDEQTRAVAAEENLRLSIAQNTNAINNEQVLREEADTNLSTIINTEKTTRQTQFSELQSALSEEVARAANKEAQISQALNDAIVQTNSTIDARCTLESTERINAINKLQSDIMARIDVEAESRGTSDELLQIKIDEEVTVREEEVENLRVALFDEINTARAAESELSRRLASEEKTRTNEDLAIMVALNSEKQERQEEDVKLAGLIEEETERANKADNELHKAIETEKNKIDVLIGNDKDKSARTIANEELAEQLLSDDAEASFKTLQELAAWIENHPEDAATINATLQQLQRDLKSEVQLREAQINGLNFSLKEEINRAKNEEDKIVQYVNKILFETELIIDSNEKKNTTY